jgi:DNA processing protein
MFKMTNLVIMNPPLLYQIALTQVPNIGAIQARLLIDHFGDAQSVFKAKKKDIAAVIGEAKARSIKDFSDFDDAEAEILFTEKHHIQPLFLTDKEYPQRLLHCYDPPPLLYYRGNADLNNRKSVSIIGTRSNTDYGKQITESLVAGLAELNVLIISGLAYGIDGVAHKAALQNNLQTVGVLAHGLDTIYPPQHKQLAKEMLLNGGLLTEFPKNTKADRHNFPKRNRIVAGMADATIVIETAAKGGSMITAELAYNYNRDLFAVPGRTSDSKSLGCLKLIQQNKAILLSDADQLMQVMGWQENVKQQKKKTRELFIELTAEERILVDMLKDRDSVHIDEFHLKSNLSSSSVAEAMLNLELQNVIASLPGKLYRLN